MSAAAKTRDFFPSHLSSYSSTLPHPLLLLLSLSLSHSLANLSMLRHLSAAATPFSRLVFISSKPMSVAAAATSFDPEVTQATNTVMGMLHEAKDRGYIGEAVSQQEVLHPFHIIFLFGGPIYSQQFLFSSPVGHFLLLLVTLANCP
jgi:hypothetical protein